MATRDELKSRASQIKNEVEEGRNTANRVGGLLEDFADSMATKTELDNYKTSNDEQLATLGSKLGAIVIKQDSFFVNGFWNDGLLDTTTSSLINIRSTSEKMELCDFILSLAREDILMDAQIQVFDESGTELTYEAAVYKITGVSLEVTGLKETVHTKYPSAKYFTIAVRKNRGKYTFDNNITLSLVKLKDPVTDILLETQEKVNSLESDIAPLEFAEIYKSNNWFVRGFWYNGTLQHLYTWDYNITTPELIELQNIFDIIVDDSNYDDMDIQFQLFDEGGSELTYNYAVIPIVEKITKFQEFKNNAIKQYPTAKYFTFSVRRNEGSVLCDSKVSLNFNIVERVNILEYAYVAPAIKKYNISESNDYTYAGACNTFIRAIREVKPKMLFLFTSTNIFQTKRDVGTDSDKMTEMGKAVAHYWGFPYLDIRFSSQFFHHDNNESTAILLSKDGVHTNEVFEGDDFSVSRRTARFVADNIKYIFDDWSNKKILWVGTSEEIGYNKPVQYSYPNLTASILGCTVNNMALPSCQMRANKVDGTPLRNPSTIRDQMDSILAIVAEYDLVVISHAMNDYVQDKTDFDLSLWKL